MVPPIAVAEKSSRVEVTSAATYLPSILTNLARGALDAAPDAMIIIDPSGVIHRQVSGYAHDKKNSPLKRARSQTAPTRASAVNDGHIFLVVALADGGREVVQPFDLLGA
jgi:hypothetical protein